MSAIRPARVSERGTYDVVAGRSAALVISSYSSSFGAASRLLGEPVRTHVRNVYALVRIADEIVDDPDAGLSAPQRDELLTGLCEDTARSLHHGRSSNLVVQAFATTARAVGITPQLVDPFFDSMRTDLHVACHDAESLERYIYGSAEVVGLMCLRAFLHDATDPEAYERLASGARRLGAAFQKINFLRDLAEDQAVLGRSYFPGIDLHSFTDADRDSVLDDIESDLVAAATVIPQLPATSRRAVQAAHSLFTELARRLRATPAATIRRERVRVPGPVKARVLLQALRVRGDG